MTRAVREHHLVLDGRPVLLLEGPAGWGESSLLPGYPCDPAASRRAASEAATIGWPAPLRTAIPVNALVTGPAFDPADLARYAAVKVKVGRPGDVDLVAAVRDAIGPRPALRVDANAAWDLDDAARMIARLARFGLELVEQPVASLDDLARLRRRVSVPLAADECVRSPADADQLRVLGAADALVVKVQPAGGVRSALELAERSGVPAIPTSMHETSVGVAAGAALAAALPQLPYACGLATVAARATDVVVDRLVPDRGLLPVRPVAPEAALLARYAAPAPSSQVVSS